MRKLFLLLMVLPTLISCNRSEKTVNHQTQANFREVIDYEMKDVLIKDTSCEKSIMNCTHVQLEYPEFTGNNSNFANRLTHNLITYLLFNKDLQNKKVNNLVAVSKDYINDYYRFKRSFPKSSQVWAFILDSKPIYEHDSLFCFSYVFDNYRGGTHGIIEKYFLTFNRYTGKKFWPLDLIKNVDSFKKLAEKKFRELKKLKPDEDLDKAGFFKPFGKFRLPANIGINNKGIILHYNPYEIAPYSQGPTELIIGFQEAEIARK